MQVCPHGAGRASDRLDPDALEATQVGPVDPCPTPSNQGWIRRRIGTLSQSFAHILSTMAQKRPQKRALRIAESPSAGMDRGDRIRTCDLVLPKQIMG